MTLSDPLEALSDKICVAMMDSGYNFPARMISINMVNCILRIVEANGLWLPGTASRQFDLHGNSEKSYFLM